MIALPTAPLWDWRDQVICCICAPHAGILLAAEWRLLWGLDRRITRYVPHARQIKRLHRIVGRLDRYAVDHRIVWP
jgi:hypothetical protein